MQRMRILQRSAATMKRPLRGHADNGKRLRFLELPNLPFSADLAKFVDLH
jgi:hypothetical protein